MHVDIKVHIHEAISARFAEFSRVFAEGLDLLAAFPSRSSKHVATVGCSHAACSERNLKTHQRNFISVHEHNIKMEQHQAAKALQ